MKGNIIIWIIFSAIGVILIALPDKGPRLISFSEAHGPGLVDTIGIVLIIVGWIFIVVGIWKKREMLMRYQASNYFSISIITVGFSYGLIMASVFSDFTLWWAVGILLLLFMHILYICVVIREDT